jgi:hypothetical protein
MKDFDCLAELNCDGGLLRSELGRDHLGEKMQEKKRHSRDGNAGPPPPSGPSFPLDPPSLEFERRWLGGNRKEMGPKQRREVGESWNAKERSRQQRSPKGWTKVRMHIAACRLALLTSSLCRDA